MITWGNRSTQTDYPSILPLKTNTDKFHHTLVIYKYQIHLPVCPKPKIHALIGRMFTHWGLYIALLSIKSFSSEPLNRLYRLHISNYEESRDTSISKVEDNDLATERLKFLNEIPYGNEKNFKWEKSFTVEHDFSLPNLPQDYRVAQELHS